MTRPLTPEEKSEIRKNIGKCTESISFITSKDLNVENNTYFKSESHLINGFLRSASRYLADAIEISEKALNENEIDSKDDLTN